MKNAELSKSLGLIDEVIEDFTTQKRASIDAFVQNHFTVKEALQIQKKSMIWDLAFYPLNTLWSIPYLTLKKGAETLEKLGWSRGSDFVGWVPSGFKTRYQKETEHLLANEFLANASEELMAGFKKKAHLDSYLSEADLHSLKLKISSVYKQEVDKFTSSQVMVTDLITSFVTLLAGRYFFGDSSLGFLGMGTRIAKKVANDNAANHFFLGKKAGGYFYRAFPVAPTQTQIWVATIGLGCLLTVFSIAAAIFSDPLKKALGLHTRKLQVLLETLEQDLFLTVKAELKKKLKESQEAA
ncbi:MAG: hypothetical protein J7501_05670 [Bdellovibrio sp.]|nr:hypothetical protein [Bdellovibrio sp.]